MSEKRFKLDSELYEIYDYDKLMALKEVVDLLNEQQELIEELHISDNMGWGRAEKFEKELKQKKIYIKRLEYKVQKFKEMNSEQQDTISQLDQENTNLVGDKIRSLEEFEKCTDKLKKTILNLREENEQLKRDEQLYAKEILRLKQELTEAQMLKLGGDY